MTTLPEEEAVGSHSMNNRNKPVLKQDFTSKEKYEIAFSEDEHRDFVTLTNKRNAKGADKITRRLDEVRH